MILLNIKDIIQLRTDLTLQGQNLSFSGRIQKLVVLIQKKLVQLQNVLSRKKYQLLQEIKPASYKL